MVGVDVASLVGGRESAVSAFDRAAVLPAYGPRAAVTGSAILLGLFLVGVIGFAVAYWRRR
jgi:hypothetical protein